MITKYGILHKNAAIKWSDEHDHLLEGFSGGDKISTDELLTVKCDVLIPAAREDRITDHNAAQVHAKLIVEGANGPTNAKGQRIAPTPTVAVDAT